jgi:glycosyltransferase involved in cell wall biosynthesis
VPKVSVTIITRNEAANIARALESVAWADEVIVVDSHSTDETATIARRFTPHVVAHDFESYAEQKNYAASLAAHDWVLSVDADESVSGPLRDEIRGRLAGEPDARGFRIPRVSHYLGRWVRSTDWYPDYQLRLYDRRAAQWKRRRVHESVEVQGPVATLTRDLEHFPYRDVSHHLQTIDRYTTLAARDMFEQGRRAGWTDVAIHPGLAFMRNYVLRGGIRQGSAGLVISTLNSYYVFLKFAKLWELQQRAARGQST